MGRKTPATLDAGKAAAALTTALSGWTHSVDVGEVSRIALLFDYTYNSATSIEIQLERSDDNSTWYTDMRESATLGTLEVDELTYAAGASDTFAVLVDVSDCRYLRVTAKRTGGAATDTLALVVTGGIGA